MKVVSILPHPHTFTSTNGKDSITIPPRVSIDVRDNFFLADSIPEGIRVIEPSVAAVTDFDKPEASSSDSDKDSSSNRSSKKSGDK